MDYTVKNNIEKYIKENLKESRLKHTYGVAEIAVELSELYGSSVEKAEIAALCHDIFKNISIEAANELVKKYELNESVYLDNLNLSHSKLAEIAARERFGIDDRDILNAISYHTTGRFGMSTLEKIIFVADGIEYSRNYPGIDEIRKKAFENLDEACLMLLEHTRDYLVSQGVSCHEDSLKGIEYFNKLLNRRNNG